MGGWLTRGRKARRRGACRLAIRLKKDLVWLGSPGKLCMPHVQGCRPMAARGPELRNGEATYRKCGGSTGGEHWRLNFV